MDRVVRTGSASQTQELASAIARLVRAGDLILLCGDLGAGKTAFTQGFGRALGVEDSITSPTFTIASQYRSNQLLVNHLDVYRLDSPAELADLGLAELIDDDAVTLIEWGDRIEGYVGPSFLRVDFSFGDGDDDREIRITDHGSQWSDRVSQLAALEVGSC